MANRFFTSLPQTNINCSASHGAIEQHRKCSFVIATNQLRTRDSSDIDLLLYCHTRPTIETTKNLRLGCFMFDYL
jgi:hypothetical protein